MNRFAALGLAVEAASGKSIIVITRTLRQNADVLDQLVAVPDASHCIAKTRRANGEQSVDYLSGGTVRIRSHGQGTRGMSADIIFLDDGVDQLVSVPHGWACLNASLAASPHAELVRT
ncbi:hypothetical protein [Pseudoclavibacter sp. AY1H1]|uniref:hypothetical protein n=1 Tax=Pseudoclavibacter sp. AY1H1 TaxID=2080584 RepID=UPI000CE75005|nr:hypothetical protein [Pseudoclavibacter sp. AY1H1]PPF39963.1 hypothetical protein C5E05_01760 [Pseudoclavibacter sp. AY1H1]